MTRKVVRFTVDVVVEDHGEFDEQYAADAIYQGIKVANDEGYLTSYNDETTEVLDWEVSYERATS